MSGRVGLGQLLIAPMVFGLMSCSFGEIGMGGGSDGTHPPTTTGPGPVPGVTPGKPGSGTTPMGLMCTSVPPSVGVSPLRRLTRSQYNHTVRDLLGIPGDYATALALDEKVGRFFSNASAPVTDVLVEQYMNTSETLATQAVTTKLNALVGCDPAKDDQAACGAKFVDSFGLKAFRRPMLPEERTAMVALFELGRKDESFAAGIQRVIQAMLQSPQFLYHIELGLAPAGSPEIVGLDQYKLGSRLSYFLWDSMPDPELLRAAGAGELSTPDALRAQATRLLADPRAADTIASFHRQWLGLDQLPDLEKDAKAYPAYNPAMRDAMDAETARFTNHVIRVADGRLDTLLTAPFSFVDPALSKLYGITLPAGFDATKPFNMDATKRAGILTHASVLAVHAHADQSSPIRRGKMVREDLFCQPLSPPPPGVDITPPVPDPNASTRERFEMHRKSPTCAACHTLIDPLGFGFENYDGVGAFRTTEAGKPIDASGDITGTDVDGSFNGVMELSKKLAQSQDVRTCIAQQWFNYALGRTHGDADACSLDAMVQAFSKTNNIRDLLSMLVATDAFRYGRFEKGAP
ncbi:MAG TPA: DUF1592 domain-containing protein [Polyangia bacterium]|jgi:hypothetical protein|nr:DUF1592 domain-containing protein [Polyangia bacterium]